MTKPTATRTQHTPGPWKVIDRRKQDGARKDGNLTPWVIYSDGPIVEPVCRVAQEFIGERAGSTDEERALQNARLIAAAPALVEALRDLLDAMHTIADGVGDVPDWNEGGEYYEACDNARAALALVDGK